MAVYIATESIGYAGTMFAHNYTDIRVMFNEFSPFGEYTLATLVVTLRCAMRTMLRPVLSIGWRWSSMRSMGRTRSVLNSWGTAGRPEKEWALKGSRSRIR